MTRSYDPINAPKFKVNAKVAYNADHGFHGNMGFRYIPELDWSAGVHYGTIDEYLVIEKIGSELFLGKEGEFEAGAKITINLKIKLDPEYKRVGRSMAHSGNAKFPW